MAEGQDKFCEDTGFFVDFTSSTIDTIVDQPRYAIPDRTISILDLWNGNTRLARYQEYMKTAPSQSSQSVVFNPDSQTPYGWQADQQTGLITLIPTPQEAITINIRLWRYSEFSLDSNDTDGNGTNAEPEIPVRFQRACIAWAAFKAYSDHDAEKGDKLKAGDHLSTFEMYVSDGKKALRRFQTEETIVSGNPIYLFR
jgi:hypothetical protein